ncbi:MAG: type II toxin-antitoxin system PemK/MazF family toxin [Gracilibacteraceae bacterium]|jgi:mRNA interferase MazF|nr:type II toxin-antitoxin system PemK/MazF family toxin [Gracilibacteraceae bacterium]
MNIDLQETQNIIDATKEQIYLQGKTHTGNRAKPRRGQVFNCHFGVGVGSEFQKRRPCVILSNEINNINSAVVIVAPITHTQKSMPICVQIADKFDANGTAILDGCANLAGLRAVSSYRLAGFICELDNNEMKQIDAAIAKHLDVIHHYNTLLKVIEDDKRHVSALNSVLEELRGITGAPNNKELVEAVRALFGKNTNDDF